jgi:hypothetical protein
MREAIDRSFLCQRQRSLGRRRSGGKRTEVGGGKGGILQGGREIVVPLQLDHLAISHAKSRGNVRLTDDRATLSVAPNAVLRCHDSAVSGVKDAGLEAGASMGEPRAQDGSSV